MLPSLGVKVKLYIARLSGPTVSIQEHLAHIYYFDLTEMFVLFVQVDLSWLSGFVTPVSRMEYATVSRNGTCFTQLTLTLGLK
jgi:hypothetical protein